MYSLCQLVDECQEVKGQKSGASKSLAQQLDNDALNGDAADGYLIEKSPQRLIEKLSIATPHPRPPATRGTDDSSAFPRLAQPSTAAAAAPTANGSSNFFRSCPKPASSAVAPSTLQQQEQQQQLRSSSPIRLSDFFCESVVSASASSSPSTSSSSTASSIASTTSSASSSPSYPLSVDASWLINAPYDPSTLPSRIVYQLPYPSGNRSPQEQQCPQQVDGSPSSTSTSHELAEADDAQIENRSEDSFQVTVASSHAGDSSAEKTFYAPRSLSTIADTPKPSTIHVFVPFTEEMDKGYLGFTNDENKMMSKCEFLYPLFRF